MFTIVLPICGGDGDGWREPEGGAGVRRLVGEQAKVAEAVEDASNTDLWGGGTV